jgi:UDPglucose 6-dehydrogenase
MATGISVIGLGFVGLTMAVVFASRGFKVLGIELDENKVARIRSGEPYFYERNLPEMLRDVVNKKLLKVSNRVDEAISSTNLIFIAVGTPPRDRGKDREADLSYISKSAIEVGRALSESEKKYHTIVVRSTVPPGTTEEVVGKNISKYSNKHRGKDFGLVFNPEFLREGSAIDDLLSPHVLVIGSNEPKSARKLHSLYKAILGQNLPHVIQTNIPTAELIKYANNSFIATKVSFINTIANICSKIPNVDVQEVARAIGLDPRIGGLALMAGPGYGGSCLPKDVSALIDFSQNRINYEPVLLKSVQAVNERQPLIILDMILNLLNLELKGKKISILGLAFKKDTDDVRESISIKLINELKQTGAKLSLHDPMAIENAKKVLEPIYNEGEIEYCKDILSCISNSECTVIMTDWDEYKNISSSMFKKYMRKANVIDAKRVLNDKRLNGINFNAIGLGKLAQLS